MFFYRWFGVVLLCSLGWFGCGDGSQSADTLLCEADWEALEVRFFTHKIELRTFSERPTRVLLAGLRFGDEEEDLPAVELFVPSINLPPTTFPLLIRDQVVVQNGEKTFDCRRCLAWR